MNNSNFWRQTKEVMSCIYDAHGNRRVFPIGTLRTAKPSARCLKLLYNYTLLIKNTKIVCEETKAYLTSQSNFNIAMEELGAELNKTINGKTARNKIHYDKMKVSSIIGENLISDCLHIIDKVLDSEEEKRTSDQLFNNYDELIKAAYVKFSDTPVLGANLMLPLNTDVEVFEIDDEEFESFISVIAPYTKSHMQFISDNIPQEQVGYYNYLCAGFALSDRDKERFKVLNEMLG